MVASAMAPFPATLAAAVAAGPTMQTASAPQRAAILEACRPAAEAELGVPVRLHVRTLRVEGRWAFLLATLQDRSGGPIDLKRTTRADAAAQGMVSNDYVALLSHGEAGWSVVASAVGPTDAVWADWPATYGAPAAVVRP